MELDESGFPQPTGRFETLAADTVILALGQATVSIPVAVELSPYFSSTGEMAVQLDEAGADGLVLFNRFLQPDIDAETLAVVSQVGSVSSP